MKVRTPLAAAGILVAMAAPAAAHISPEETTVPAGSFTSVTLTVPHGCDDSPTRELAVQIPEGAFNVSPAVHPGWTVAMTREQLPEPVEAAHGEVITERVSVVTFTALPGNELPNELRDSFTIGFRSPDERGATLRFPVIQTCVAGETAWIEETPEGGEEPEHPAPEVTLTAEADGDDGTDGVAVAGLVAGLLGLGLGGVALARSRRP